MLQSSQERITLLLILGAICSWFLLLLASDLLPSYVVVVLLTLVTTLYNSLQHECIHAHPFKKQWINDALASVPLLCLVPYLRFKKTHTQHHQNEILTTPELDPESRYLYADDFNQLSKFQQLLLRTKSCIAGQFFLSPALDTYDLIVSDLRNAKDPDIITAWALHLIMLPLTLGFAIWTDTLMIALLSSYFASSMLSIRSFLEHRAHLDPNGRSVIIDSTGLLALLFLFNNYHLVHHQHPSVVWHQLPSLYRSQKKRFDAYSHGYVFDNYFTILKLFAFKEKEPVVHPLLHKKDSA